MFTTSISSNRLQPTSGVKERSINIAQKWSNSEKRKTINLMRLANLKQSISWNIPYPKFVEAVENNNNSFSLLVTLFEISEDPQWRNRVSHMCILLKKLHNICIKTYGSYLSQIQYIPNYEGKLINIFYLQNNQVQEHFKLLIKGFLHYNSKYYFLQEENIAIGLIDCMKNQKQKIPECFWILSQIKTGAKAIGKILKMVQNLINSQQINKFSIVLPALTILSNYVYYQTNIGLLEQLLESTSFQNILLISIKAKEHFQISREALLLCNNLLAKSLQLSRKLLSSQLILEAAVQLVCEEQQIFQKLISIRQAELTQ